MNILFVLLILLVSSFVPIAIADDGSEAGTGEIGSIEYTVIAKTISLSGGAYTFENIPNGHYSIISKTMMGESTHHTGIESVKVENGNVNINTHTVTTTSKAEESTEIKVLRIYEKIKDEIGISSSTGYTITGTAHRGATARADIELFLVSTPIITTIVTDEDSEKYTITVEAYGAETVKIKYTDKTGSLEEDDNPQKTGNEYEFEIKKEDLTLEPTIISITATNGLKTTSETTEVSLVDVEYEVVAATKSNSSTVGSNNFKFENVPAGKYVIMSVYFMGSGRTEYAAVEEIEVSGNTQTNDIYVVKCDGNAVISGIFRLHQMLINETPTYGGTFDVEGAIRSSGSNRPDLDLILVKAPVIANIVKEEKVDEKDQLTITTIGAESVSVEYTDSTGSKKIENKTPDISADSAAGKVFTVTIDKEHFNFGYTDVSVIAHSDESAYMEKVTLVKADPALIGTPRKFVIISGYETHNKIITDLTAKYGENGSNVELVSLETKTIMDKTPEEIQTLIAGADVISIHMVSTTPTWNYLRAAILAECAGGNVVILDDNSTRQETAYNPYTVPSIPGISDTKDNFGKYQEKVRNYWSNTPYEHKNLENMINMILIDFYGRYDLDRPEQAVELPIKGIYHPHLENIFETDYDEYIKWYSENEEIWGGEDSSYKYNPENPTVGITFYKSYYPDKMEPTAKLIEELEKKGVNVLAVYCEAPAKFDTDTDGGIYFRKGEIDAVLNYRYIGEHRFDQVELNVPVFNILIVDEAAEWEDSSNPFGNSSMKLVNQELIGAIDPIAVVSTEEIDGSVQNKPIVDQVDWMVERVIGQLNLQAKDNYDKNVAVVYYNHGGGKGNIGASYLDVPASTVNLLNAMKADDYNIDTSLVPDAETMVNFMITQGINVGGWAPGELKKLVGDVDISGNEEIYDTGKAVLISTELYEKWFKEIYLGEWFDETIKTLSDEEKVEKTEKQTKLYEQKKTEVAEMWGTAPGNIMVYQNKYIIVPYIDVSDSETGGSVILTPQPSRGHSESIETLYHDTNMPPTHQYIAFYLWLQHGSQRVVGNGNSDDYDSYPKEDKYGFGADAIIHMGRHGTQEWLPGKETALSRYDWPSVMAGNVPIIYPYIVDGVGEGIVAKRRGNAVLIDHMTPAIVYAGLYGDYAALESSLQSYETVENEEVKAGHLNTIIEILVLTELNIRLGVTEEELREMDETELDKVFHDLEDILEDLKTSYMPYGLHILGQALEGEALKEMVFSMLSAKYTQSVTDVSGATFEDAYDILSRVIDGADPDTAIDDVFGSKTNQPDAAQKTKMKEQLNLGKEYAANLIASEGEMDQILRGLRGEFIAPKVGGDPVTRPQVLPTGGNFYTIDQRRVPTEEAWAVAVRLTDELLAEYYEENGKWPSSIGYVLWAGETTRTEGIMEAQIMYLIGIKPRWSSGNVDASNFDVIPANDLTVEINGETKTRPRIDVIVEISGVYRDTFPEKVLMLDRAIRLAYEQTDGVNNIRENTDKIISSGYSKDEALSRIFGPASDSYGAGMENLIGSTNSWTDGNDLAEHFINRMGFVYNSLGEWGTTNDKELYKSQLSNVDATVHSRSSPLYGALDIDDFYQYLGGLNAAVSYSREDGKMPDSYVMNLQKPGEAKVDTLKEFIENEAYARYLNQKWMDGMKEHGYAGAREVAKMFENLWGWEALDPNLISDKMWNDLYQHLLTGENGEWLKSDPQYAYSHQSAVARLIQAATKDDGKYWNADPAVLNQLVKDYVESVAQHGVACCDHTCGNPLFDKFIAGQMSVAGITVEEQKEFLQILETATERTISGNTGVGSGSDAGGSARIVNNSESANEGSEQGGGYGTDLGTAPPEVTGYEMTTTETSGTIEGIRDFMQNPSFSSSSAAALAIVILAAGAVFYGLKRKD